MLLVAALFTALPAPSTIAAAASDFVVFTDAALGTRGGCENGSGRRSGSSGIDDRHIAACCGSWHIANVVGEREINVK